MNATFWKKNATFWKKFDDLFKRMDSMTNRLSEMPIGATSGYVDHDGFFHTVTTTEFTEAEPNPKMEYLVKEVFTMTAGCEAGLEANLNSLGDDGWDLIHYGGDIAIFSRVAE